MGFNIFEAVTIIIDKDLLKAEDKSDDTDDAIAATISDLGLGGNSASGNNNMVPIDKDPTVGSQLKNAVYSSAQQEMQKAVNQTWQSVFAQFSKIIGISHLTDTSITKDQLQQLSKFVSQVAYVHENYDDITKANFISSYRPEILLSFDFRSPGDVDKTTWLQNSVYKFLNVMVSARAMKLEKVAMLLTKLTPEPLEDDDGELLPLTDDELEAKNLVNGIITEIEKMEADSEMQLKALTLLEKAVREAEFDYFPRLYLSNTANILNKSEKFAKKHFPRGLAHKTSDLKVSEILGDLGFSGTNKKFECWSNTKILVQLLIDLEKSMSERFPGVIDVGEKPEDRKDTSSVTPFSLHNAVDYKIRLGCSTDDSFHKHMNTNLSTFNGGGRHKWTSANLPDSTDAVFGSGIENGLYVLRDYCAEAGLPRWKKLAFIIDRMSKEFRSCIAASRGGTFNSTPGPKYPFSGGDLDLDNKTWWNAKYQDKFTFIAGHPTGPSPLKHFFGLTGISNNVFSKPYDDSATTYGMGLTRYLVMGKKKSYAISHASQGTPHSPEGYQKFTKIDKKLWASLGPTTEPVVFNRMVLPFERLSLTSADNTQFLPGDEVFFKSILRRQNDDPTKITAPPTNIEAAEFFVGWAEDFNDHVSKMAHTVMSILFPGPFIKSDLPAWTHFGYSEYMKPGAGKERIGHGSFPGGAISGNYLGRPKPGAGGSGLSTADTLMDVFVKTLETAASQIYDSMTAADAAGTGGTGVWADLHSAPQAPLALQLFIIKLANDEFVNEITFGGDGAIDPHNVKLRGEGSSVLIPSLTMELRQRLFYHMIFMGSKCKFEIPKGDGEEQPQSGEAFLKSSTPHGSTIMGNTSMHGNVLQGLKDIVAGAMKNSKLQSKGFEGSGAWDEEGLGSSGFSFNNQWKTKLEEFKSGVSVSGITFSNEDVALAFLCNMYRIAEIIRKFCEELMFFDILPSAHPEDTIIGAGVDGYEVAFMGDGIPPQSPDLHMSEIFIWQTSKTTAGDSLEAGVNTGLDIDDMDPVFMDFIFNILNPEGAGVGMDLFNIMYDFIDNTYDEIADLSDRLMNDDRPVFPGGNTALNGISKVNMHAMGFEILTDMISKFPATVTFSSENQDAAETGAGGVPILHVDRSRRIKVYLEKSKFRNDEHANNDSNSTGQALIDGTWVETGSPGLTNFFKALTTKKGSGHADKHNVYGDVTVGGGSWDAFSTKWTRSKPIAGEGGDGGAFDTNFLYTFQNDINSADMAVFKEADLQAKIISFFVGLTEYQQSVLATFENTVFSMKPPEKKELLAQAMQNPYKSMAVSNPMQLALAHKSFYELKGSGVKSLDGMINKTNHGEPGALFSDDLSLGPASAAIFLDAIKMEIFKKDDGFKKRIMTIGIPSGMISSLQNNDQGVINKYTANEPTIDSLPDARAQARKVQILKQYIKISIWRQDSRFEGLIFYPQSFIYDTSLFMSNTSIASYKPGANNNGEQNTAVKNAMNSYYFKPQGGSTFEFGSEQTTKNVFSDVLTKPAYNNAADYAFALPCIFINNTLFDHESFVTQENSGAGSNIRQFSEISKAFEHVEKSSGTSIKAGFLMKSTAANEFMNLILANYIRLTTGLNTTELNFSAYSGEMVKGLSDENKEFKEIIDHRHHMQHFFNEAISKIIGQKKSLEEILAAGKADGSMAQQTIDQIETIMAVGEMTGMDLTDEQILNITGLTEPESLTLANDIKTLVTIWNDNNILINGKGVYAKALSGKLFDRIYNILIDPDDFQINYAASFENSENTAGQTLSETDFIKKHCVVRSGVALQDGTTQVLDDENLYLKPSVYNISSFFATIEVYPIKDIGEFNA